jgi:hypothetical protein
MLPPAESMGKRAQSRHVPFGTSGAIKTKRPHVDGLPFPINRGTAPGQ